MLCSGAVGVAAAQSTVPERFDPTPNFSYAVFVGSGIYTLNDRRVYIARMPFSWKWRKADEQPGALGIRFLLPATVGVTNFEHIEDLPSLSIDDLSSLSFVPGVELEYAATPNLFVKPFLQAGLGWEFQDEETTFVWGAGMRARLALAQDKSDWLVGGEVLAAGNVPSDEQPSTSLSRIGLGIEHKYPLRWQLSDRKTSLHTQLIGYHYVDEATFNSPQGDIKLRSTIQFGLSIGVEPAIRFLGFSVRQIGLGYKYGEDFSAITIVTSFPF
jgi:hypothetical protein